MTDLARIASAYELAHAPGRAAAAESNIIFGAWFTAFVLPIVGFALGVVLTVRQREGHGIWIMVISTVAPFLWYLVISSLSSHPQYRSARPVPPGRRQHQRGGFGRSPIGFF